MKKNVRIAALALAACGLMAACNNNAPAELVDTVVPIDTTVVEEIIDTLPEVDTPVVEQPVVKKAATTKKNTTAKKTETNSVQLTNIKSTKKNIEEVQGELKQGEGNSVGNKALNPNSKPNPADAFNKK